MNKIDNIHLRRQLLDWRDNQVEKIHNHLNREIIFLFCKLDMKIEEIPLSKIFKSETYFKKHLEPIYTQWIDNEVTSLIKTAQNDLNEIYQHKIEYKKNHSSLRYQDGNDSVRDATTATLSTGIAVAAIPTIVSLSTTTVSAGGLLGLLGVTTTVISWPIALAGGTVVLGLSFFGVGKAGNLKKDAIKRFKEKIHESIRNRVIYSKANDSICQHLQSKIGEVTKNFLSVLET